MPLSLDVAEKMADAAKAKAVRNGLLRERRRSR